MKIIPETRHMSVLGQCHISEADVEKVLMTYLQILIAD